jgi:hypothetical protein
MDAEDSPIKGYLSRLKMFTGKNVLSLKGEGERQRLAREGKVHMKR